MALPCPCPTGVGGLEMYSTDCPKHGLGTYYRMTCAVQATLGPEDQAEAYDLERQRQGLWSLMNEVQQADVMERMSR